MIWAEDFHTELIPWCQWDWCSYEELNLSIKVLGPALGFPMIMGGLVVLRVWVKSRDSHHHYYRRVSALVPFVAALMIVGGVGLVLRDPSLYHPASIAFLTVAVIGAWLAKRGYCDHLMDGYVPPEELDDVGDHDGRSGGC